MVRARPIAFAQRVTLKGKPSLAGFVFCVDQENGLLAVGQRAEKWVDWVKVSATWGHSWVLILRSGVSQCRSGRICFCWALVGSSELGWVKMMEREVAESFPAWRRGDWHSGWPASLIIAVPQARHLRRVNVDVAWGSGIGGDGEGCRRVSLDVVGGVVS